MHGHHWDPERALSEYPSVYRARTQLREHDDREQFLAGVGTVYRAPGVAPPDGSEAVQR